MSAFALAQIAATPTANPSTDISGRSAGTNQNPVLAAVGSIASYIPTEGISLYIAISAIASTTAANQTKTAAADSALIGWVALGVAIVINFVVVALVYPATVSSSGETFNRRRYAAQLATTIVLTVVYIAATGANPLANSFHLELTWAGIVALVLATMLPLVAPKIGLVARVAA